MAARLIDHRWSMEELLSFPVPPADLPRWRGRKPQWLLKAERAASTTVNCGATLSNLDQNHCICIQTEIRTSRASSPDSLQCLDQRAAS